MCPNHVQPASPWGICRGSITGFTEVLVDHVNSLTCWNSDCSLPAALLSWIIWIEKVSNTRVHFAKKTEIHPSVIFYFLFCWVCLIWDIEVIHIRLMFAVLFRKRELMQLSSLVAFRNFCNSCCFFLPKCLSPNMLHVRMMRSPKTTCTKGLWELECIHFFILSLLCLNLKKTVGFLFYYMRTALHLI